MHGIPNPIGVARARGGDFDVTVIEWDGRWVTLLTTYRRGRYVAVGVEVGPVLDERPVDTEKRLARRLQECTELMPDYPPEILAKDFRTLPLGAFMRARSAMVREGETGPGVNPWNDPPLRAESRKLAELADALIYVQAAEEGVSPTEAIAEAWGITPGTARAHIGRARAYGYLSEVGRGNQERSTLTDKAFQHHEDVIEQHLPEGLQRLWARKLANKLRETGDS